MAPCGPLDPPLQTRFDPSPIQLGVRLWKRCKLPSEVWNEALAGNDLVHSKKNALFGVA